jgi:DNA repair protein RecN (Recombination protein N)
MLKTLYIKNFALIDEIELKFSEGLNIITGETGAGKSVIVDAMMLILGERASADFIRSGENKAIIEGKFELPPSHPVFSILHSEELDIENGELILRRELSAKGNSRCFVNDTPVQLTLMKESGDQLVDFHGQHDHQLLLRRESHCGILDAFSPIEGNLTEYRKIYENLAEKIHQFDDLQKKEESLKEKKDNYIFELSEIEKLSPKEYEDAEIEKELSILENSELINNLSLSISSILYDNENPVRDSLVLVQKSLKELSEIDNQFSVYIDECESAIITVNEIAKYCSNYSESINFDPHRIEELRLRMSQLQLLRKKYGSLSAVLERQGYLEQELELINNYDSEIETRKAEIRDLKKLAGTEAEKISIIRKKSSVEFSRKLENILAELGIQNSSFSVKINREELGNSTGGISVIIGGKEFRARNNGIDSVEFMISTNAGEEPKPLINVASGGEISRVMLALKSIAAMSESLPMLVFDEIDTGVSGRIAQKVGEQMKKLAKNHQIIAITHLPQIAAAADRNIKVTKSEEEDRTRITVAELKNSEKAEEVARLFSGDTITATALKTAKDLIGYYK